MELCEALSFCAEDAGGYFPTEAAARALVRRAGGGGDGTGATPDVILLSVRAITYLCDAMPRAGDAVVRHGLLPVLCSRLLAIEYLDVAEQGYAVWCNRAIAGYQDWRHSILDYDTQRNLHCCWSNIHVLS
ncbi:E3 ubiquitin-protein ligase UPL4-like isoform X2 [Miscanthus floridulus]|uniref:E3 ubiquitin-protein ligase UPL4-like isoform X2 n=1 Tax=Miscanthus floridulus TaxID=154761 RepID=UPI003458F270